MVLAALLLSFSRAAMISLGVALLALAWLERHRLRIAFRPAGWTVAVSTCLVSGSAALVYWFFPGFLAAYFERFWYSLEYLLSAPNLILSRRLESWGFLLDYLRENPWHSVFGIGYKTLPYSEFLGRPIVADNMYLSLLIETGWLGFSGLLLLNVAVLVTTYRLATSSGSGGSGLRRLFGVWMFCFWCGQIVQMMTGDVLTYWRILPAFFAVLGVGVRGEDPLS